MDYNKINTFILVAKLKSITSAANLLKRSQSAISQQIQSLEIELGIQLLERKGGKIHLSADGEKLLHEVESSFTIISDTVSEISKSKERIEGQIRLGLISDNSTELDIENIISRFCKKYPKVSFSICYGENDEIEQGLIKNNLDIGVLVFFKNPEMFIRKGLGESKHRVYASKAHIKKNGEPKRYKELLDMPLLDIDAKFSCFKHWFKKNSPKTVRSLSQKTPHIVVANHLSLARFVKQGQGIALLPEYIKEDSEFKKYLVEIFPDSQPVSTGADITYRTHKTISLIEKLFISEFTA